MSTDSVAPGPMALALSSQSKVVLPAPVAPPPVMEAKALLVQVTPPSVEMLEVAAVP